MMEIDISVVIPCLNERQNIETVLSSLDNELQQGGFTYEIIVVDNGSTDGSVEIAKTYNATVLFSSSTTVAGVRNLGAEKANGKTLVFVDADVVVQPSWGKTLRHIFQNTNNLRNMITGSNCSVPDNIKPLLYSWYKGISSDVRNTHLGTGHMIVSKDCFNKIGGFNTDLVSGEDYDFCLRGKKKGVPVISDPRLVACHLGYPAKIYGFIKREIWHGASDYRSWKSIINSKVAICGIIFLIINILMLIALFVNIMTFFILMILLIAIIIYVNFYKFGFGGLSEFSKRSIVSYIYLLCRGLSFPINIIRRNIKTL